MNLSATTATTALAWDMGAYKAPAELGEQNAADVADPSQLCTIETQLNELKGKACEIAELTRRLECETSDGDDAAHGEVGHAKAQENCIRVTVEQINGEIHSPMNSKQKKLPVLKIDAAVKTAALAADAEKMTLSTAITQAEKVHTDKIFKAVKPSISLPTLRVALPAGAAAAATGAATRPQWMILAERAGQTMHEVGAHVRHGWNATVDAVGEFAHDPLGSMQRGYAATVALTSNYVVAPVMDHVVNPVVTHVSAAYDTVVATGKKTVEKTKLVINDGKDWLVAKWDAGKQTVASFFSSDDKAKQEAVAKVTPPAEPSFWDKAMKQAAVVKSAVKAEFQAQTANAADLSDLPRFIFSKATTSIGSLLPVH